MGVGNLANDLGKSLGDLNTKNNIPKQAIFVNEKIDIQQHIENKKGYNMGEANFKPTSQTKPTYADQVSEKIIEAIEAGTAPWMKPWDGAELFGMMPQNATTGKAYNGINAIHLLTEATVQGYSDPRWVTYKQAEELGANVKKGEKSTLVQYWKFKDFVNVLDADGNPVLKTDGKPQKEEIKLENPKVFYASVFNAQQCENMPKLETKPLMWDVNELAETILLNSGAKIKNVPGDRAFYSPSQDAITLPLREQFPTQENYYSTALHELGHWTGHEDRLDRDLSGSFGSESYAKEELRAEIASFMLSARIGIDHDPSQHYSYIGSWAEALQEDSKEIFRAARDAEKIADFVEGLSMEKVQEQTIREIETVEVYQVMFNRQTGETMKRENVTDRFREQPIHFQQLVEELQFKKEALNGERGNVYYEIEGIDYESLTIPDELKPFIPKEQQSPKLTDIMDDKKTEFYENGAIKSITYSNGNHERIVPFDLAGKLHGIEKSYIGGELSLIVPYVHGEVEGLVEAYHFGISEERLLSKTCEYKNGKKHGFEKLFNPEGEIVVERIYKFGKFQSQKEPINEKEQQSPKLTDITDERLSQLTTQAGLTDVEVWRRGGLNEEFVVGFSAHNKNNLSLIYSLQQDAIASTPYWEVTSFNDETAEPKRYVSLEKAISESSIQTLIFKENIADLKKLEEVYKTIKLTPKEAGEIIRDYGVVQAHSDKYNVTHTEIEFVPTVGASPQKAMMLQRKNGDEILTSLSNRKEWADDFFTNAKEYHMPDTVINSNKSKMVVPMGISNDISQMAQSATQSEVLTKQTYLFVPYQEKDEAKKAGAKWDKENKAWYAPKDTPIDGVQKWLVENVKIEGLNLEHSSDYLKDFEKELQARGFEIDTLVDDAKIRNVKVEGNKGAEKSGSYAIHTDGRPTLWYRNYKTADEGSITHKSSNFEAGASNNELKKYEELNRIKSVQRETDIQRMHYAVSNKLENEFKTLADAPTDHPYLVKKGIASQGAKLDDKGNLVIAYKDTAGKIQTAQRISPEGNKLFEKGGAKSGNFATIGEKSGDTIVLAEGFATGASIHEATKLQVLVTGDAGNIKNVLEEIVKKNLAQKVIIAADNDLQNKHGNIGLNKAKQAVVSIEGRYPEFKDKIAVTTPSFTKDEIANKSTDFNDLAQNRGSKAVENQIHLVVQKLVQTQVVQSQNQQIQKTAEVVKDKSYSQERAR